MKLETRFLVSSLRAPFGLDNIVLNDVGHFVLIACRRLSLIGYLGNRLILSPLEIIVGLSGCGVDVIGYFRLNRGPFQNVMASCLAGSLSFINVSILLLS